MPTYHFPDRRRELLLGEESFPLTDMPSRSDEEDDDDDANSSGASSNPRVIYLYDASLLFSKSSFLSSLLVFLAL
jgi:hypothetical protein